MPPRRRSSGNRRSRVAGTHNRRPQVETPETGGSTVSLDVADRRDDADISKNVTPGPAEAENMEPETTDVGAAEADTTEAETTEPETTDVGAAEADTTEADTTEADTTEADTTEADTTEADTTDADSPGVADEPTEVAEKPAGELSPKRFTPLGRRAKRAKTTSETAPAAKKAGEQPTRARAVAKGSWVQRRVDRGFIALAVVGVISAGLAIWFAVASGQLRGSAAASNDALVDIAATSQVKGQVEDGLKKVYSYDFTRLDENERTARTVITGDFATKFDALFKTVRELAPAQQAVVSATVAVSAVKVIDGDRAIVIVFLDQQATRGIDAKQLVAAGRLTVTAQRVDGQWKIADVDSR